MTTKKIQEIQENSLEKKEVEYKLNMEILASLKELPGKTVVLGQNEIFSKTIDLKGKQKIISENDIDLSNKLTSTSYILKESQQESQEEKSEKKSFTEGSILRPIPIPLNKTENVNEPSFQFNRLLGLEGQGYFFTNYLNNFPNFFNNNTFFLLNPETYFSQLNYLNDSIGLYKFLQNKRNTEVKSIENKSASLNKSLSEIINNESKESFVMGKKKKLFNVFVKSNYIYRKRKPRKKKLVKNKEEIYCEHKGCEGTFKTKKQAVFHHFKMSNECHNDTISILKLISETKKMLLKGSKKQGDILRKYSTLYNETMKEISLSEHIDTIVGLNFGDNLV